MSGWVNEWMDVSNSPEAESRANQRLQFFAS